MKYNKLIAEFMGGGKFRTDEQGTEFVEFIPLGEWEVEKLPYHTEWNWLIPVVQKCKYSCEDSALLHSYWIYLSDEILTFDQEVIYNKVIAFIKTYNTINLK
jgi:hypothetical protein